MSSNNDNNSEVAVDKVAENNEKADSKLEKGAKRPSEDKGVDPKKAKTALNGEGDDDDEVEEEDEDVEAEEEEEEEDIPDGEEEEDEEGDGEGDVEAEDDEEDQ